MQEHPVLIRMQTLIESWEAAGDQRMIFLRCYSMMTRNVLAALQQSEFHDPAWVEHLMEHFAEYYFTALDAYHQSPSSAPRVWQVAYQAVGAPQTTALQNLLLGVNAHINYDLVLTLADILGPEWASLDSDRRAIRYTDHYHINAIIARTIDAVQDQVLEPAMPVMDIFDKLMGPLDEYLISRLLTGWRDAVWRNTTRLLETHDPQQKAQALLEIEAESLRIGAVIHPTFRIS